LNFEVLATKGPTMTTTIRKQIMAASTGALAAEHARLEAERARLEEELASLNAGLPDGAADVVARAEEILRVHSEKLAALRRARDEIDQTFGVKRREKAEAEARARQEQYGVLVGELRAAEDARCEAVATIEEHTRALRDAIKEGFAKADEVRSITKQLAVLGGVERPRFLKLAQNEFASRIGGRIAGVMTGGGPSTRLGGIEWGLSSLYPSSQTDWAEKEREHFQSDLADAIEMGRPDANA
jgi:chromosome segregation ATPase